MAANPWLLAPGVMAVSLRERLNTSPRPTPRSWIRGFMGAAYAEEEPHVRRPCLLLCALRVFNCSGGRAEVGRSLAIVQDMLAVLSTGDVAEDRTSPRLLETRQPVRW